MGRMENDLMVLLGEIPEEDLEDAFDKKKESVVCRICLQTTVLQQFDA